MHSSLRSCAVRVACLIFVVSLAVAYSDPARARDGKLWARDNLFAWGVIQFDVNKRAPQERALMLQAAGLKRFAYDWAGEEGPLSSFDAEIEAMRQHGIESFAWLFTLDAHDPKATRMLDTFQRQNIRPQLWVLQLADTKAMALSPEQEKARVKMSPRERADLTMKRARVTFPRTLEEHEARVTQEADRVHQIVKLAARYGGTVALYNHGAFTGWSTTMESQLAVIERLGERGVKDVGLVYNFSCAQDGFHDDTVNFPELWKRIQHHVVAVTLTGVPWVQVGHLIYPSQGEYELQMMRVIEESGWRGPVGLQLMPGVRDAKIMLDNALVGFDWLTAELKRTGSGGSRPVLPKP